MKASGWLGGLLTAAVLLGGGFAVLKAGPYGRQAEVGVGYAARVACACRYLGGRSLDSCTADFDPGLEIVTVTEDEAAKRITASVPLLATRSARFEGELGCALED
jgi:hypothetical protein